MAGYLFTHRTFWSVLCYTILGGSMMGVALFINPLYLQVVLNQSTFMIGVYLFVTPIVVVVFSYIAGHLNQHMNTKIILLVGAASYGMAAFLQMHFGLNINIPLIVVAFALFGLGWAINNSVLGALLAVSIEEDHMSVAVGAMYSFYNIGSAVVLALAVLIFHIKSFTNLLWQFAQSQQIKALFNQFISQPGKLQEVAHQLPMAHTAPETLLKNAFIAGASNMFWPVIILAIIAIIVILLVMPNHKPQKNSEKVHHPHIG
jgi:MFS family permease